MTETPVNMPKRIKPIKIWGPYICNCITNWGFLRIIIPEKICDPSKGGIGIMLKTAKEIFICENKIPMGIVHIHDLLRLTS